MLLLLRCLNHRDLCCTRTYLHWRGLCCSWKCLHHSKGAWAFSWSYLHLRGLCCTQTCLHWRGLCCSWRCLHHSREAWPAPGQQKHVLLLDLSTYITERCSAAGRVSFTGAWAAPGCIFTLSYESCAEPGLVHFTGASAAPGLIHASKLWASTEILTKLLK